MATWTTIDPSTFDTGKPILGATHEAISENITALAEGASGAPLIRQDALAEAFPRRRVFTSSGSFNLATEVNSTTDKLRLTVIAGGNGGAINSSPTALVNGAGGGYFIGNVNVVPGDTLTITVGSGGAGKTDNSDQVSNSGSASSVTGTGLTIQCNSNGVDSFTTTGAIANSFVTIKGKNPGQSSSEVTASGGLGHHGQDVDNFNATDAYGYGGGGGGVYNVGVINRTSGDGAPGIVIIEW